ncbi:MAG: hypothetical protein J6C23_08140 [Clostridia bacterium]|nr:hypothetical protein [Clostridia bacterium]
MEKNKKLIKGSVRLTVIVCVLCAVMCFCLFSATTFAWFTDSVTASNSTMVSADYSVISTLSKEGTTVTPDVATASGIKEYNLTSGIYKIEFTAQGSATTGFAFITVKTTAGTNTYFTQQMAPNSNYTVRLLLNENAHVTLNYQWGSHGRTENIIENGSDIN